MSIFSERLKSKRKEFQIGQVQLAQAIGVSNGTIGNIESGAACPSKNVAKKLADFFETNISYWLDEEAEMEKILSEPEFYFLTITLKELFEKISDVKDLRNPTVSNMILSMVEYEYEKMKLDKE